MQESEIDEFFHVFRWNTKLQRLNRILHTLFLIILLLFFWSNIFCILQRDLALSKLVALKVEAHVSCLMQEIYRFIKDCTDNIQVHIATYFSYFCLLKKHLHVPCCQLSSRNATILLSSDEGFHEAVPGREAKVVVALHYLPVCLTTTARSLGSSVWQKEHFTEVDSNLFFFLQWLSMCLSALLYL